MDSLDIDITYLDGHIVYRFIHFIAIPLSATPAYIARLYRICYITMCIVPLSSYQWIDTLVDIHSLLLWWMDYSFMAQEGSLAIFFISFTIHTFIYVYITLYWLPCKDYHFILHLNSISSYYWNVLTSRYMYVFNYSSSRFHLACYVIYTCLFAWLHKPSTILGACRWQATNPLAWLREGLGDHFSFARVVLSVV